MEIVVIDIETTGFRTAGGKIVEVGIVRLNTETRQIDPLMSVVTYEEGLKIEQVENSWIVKNSDLTVERIRYGVNLKHILPTIQAIVKQYPTTAFNRAFDIPFLQDRGIEFSNLHPCPMIEMTPICKLPKAGKGRGFKWPNVEEAYRHIFPGTKYIEKHRALSDARHEAQIVLYLYELQNKE